MSATPAGYKQTEVGRIPEDWRVANLGSLTSLMTNGFVGTVKQHYAENESGVLYIQGYNVEENSFNLHGIKYVTEEFHRANLKSCLRGGDLLTVQTGDVGLTTMVPDELAGSNCHALIISRFDTKRSSPAFFSYYLNSATGRSRLRLIETGTTMKHLNVGDVLEFLVPLPPTKAEQEAIAEALSDADALIESLVQLVTKKRHLKQAAMQELLTGKKRLPGFSGNWDQIPLGSMFTFKNGLNKGKEFFGYGTPIVNYMDVYCSSIIHSSGIVGRVSLTNEEVKNFDVKKGDVFFTRTSETREEIGIASVVVDEPIQTVFSGFVLRGRPKGEHLCDEFKAYCFRSEDVRSQIVSKASYTTRALTNGRILSAVMLNIPSKTEQVAIAAVLSDIDAEISDLEAQLAKTSILKQGMMQKLLTGEIRLL